MISILDTARRLAYLCHHQSQTSSFYSVAQHCVIAAYLTEQSFPKHKNLFTLRYQALLHDAYLGWMPDLPPTVRDAAITAKLATFGQEKRESILNSISIPHELPDQLESLLRRLLKTELQLFPSDRTPVLPTLSAHSHPYPLQILPLSPEQSFLMFLETYDRLMNRLPLTEEFVGVKKLRCVPERQPAIRGYTIREQWAKPWIQQHGCMAFNPMD